MMRKFILLAATFSFSASSSSIAQANLIVVVENVRSREGKILTALFDRAEGFPEKAGIGRTNEASGTSTTVVFENLTPGRYALAIIHDENGNGKLDTNAIGIPLEGFCFGNNAMGLFGPPSFKKASIVIGTRSITQKLRMRYF